MIIDKLEAYHELTRRRSEAEMTEDRAYSLVLTLTDDEFLAERSANEVAFSKTPLA